MQLYPLLAAGDGGEAVAAMMMLGGLVLGICYLIFPFVVMSRLKEIRDEAKLQTRWLKYAGEIQKLHLDECKKQTALLSGPPELSPSDLSEPAPQ